MKTAIQVVRNPSGWWDVRDRHGHVVGRYVSEFLAWEAGRFVATGARADLEMVGPGLSPHVEFFDRATGELRAANVPTQPSVPNRRHLILLVEDMFDARELYAEYLNYAGYSVVTAINGHEAVRLARMLKPDLVLMDLRLPGMDGLEATADLKADPALAHIPIVAITADPSEEANALARAAGCADFIAKPALPDAVAHAIARVLSSHGEQAHGGPCPTSASVSRPASTAESRAAEASGAASPDGRATRSAR